MRLNNGLNSFVTQRLIQRINPRFEAAELAVEQCDATIGDYAEATGVLLGVKDLGGGGGVMWCVDAVGGGGA